MREGSGRVTDEGKEREGGGEFYMPRSVFPPALHHTLSCHICH